MSAVTVPSRRRYNAAFKLHAAQLVRDQRLSVRQVREDLNIDDSSLLPGSNTTMPSVADHPGKACL